MLSSVSLMASDYSVYENLFVIMGTSAGPLIGVAKFEGMVSFSQILPFDTDDERINTLRISDEQTEMFTLLASNKVYYGFECYFEPLSEVEIHFSEHNLVQ